MRTHIDHVEPVRYKAHDPVSPLMAALTTLAILAGVLVASLTVVGCSGCALPHEHVQVLAEQAERFVELDEIEHDQGLTAEQLERKRAVGERLRARAQLAKRGLAVEGKLGPAAGDAEVGREGGK